MNDSQAELAAYTAYETAAGAGRNAAVQATEQLRITVAAQFDAIKRLQKDMKALQATVAKMKGKK